MINLSAKLDLTEWKKVWPLYTQYNKRAPSEIINTKAVFICRSAINLTKHSTPESIRSNLLSPSRTNSKAPLAAILINKQLKASHKKGLSGSSMATAIEKFIKKKNSTIGFIASGWIGALNKLNPFYKRNKDYATDSLREPKLKVGGAKQYGKPKGDAVYARPDSFHPWARIDNNVQQKHEEIQKGLQKAINLELASMQKYITDKYNKNLKKIFGN